MEYIEPLESIYYWRNMRWLDDEINSFKLCLLGVHSKDRHPVTLEKLDDE